MKKFIKNLLAVALVGAVLVSFGCKDYDEDIKSLNDRLDKVEASVADLQAEIDGGAVITGVSNTADGVVVTLSNGQSFTLKHGTNGTNGTNGKDGKDADVWTIGDDGYWYKNGTKTEYKAVGAKGDKGDKGNDGKYYVPGEDGLWDIYQDGQKVEDTNISWVGQGISAVYSNGTLTLSGVEGAENGVVTLTSGAQLGSVAFVPNTVVSGLGYPTTDEPWLVLPAYLDDTRATADWKQPWDKSNVVKTVYRLNPTDAYVGGAQYAFINRGITVRGVEGDKTTLLNEEGVALKDAGQVDVNTTFNLSGYDTKVDVNFAALQVWAGQNPVTSDYIAVFAEDVNPCIVHPKHDDVDMHHLYYKRTASLKAGETDEFVKAFVGEVGDADYPAHFYYSYNDVNALNLMPEVLLYECELNKSFAALGFTGISYKFSLPEDYLADDDDNTNQQAFINVTEDGKVTINKNGAWVNKETGSLEPAEGRTPIVRVDAYMTPNKKDGKAGAAQVVASAYIKIEITAKAISIDPKEPMPDNTVTIDDANAFDYRKLTAAYTEVGYMTWERVNSELYGSVAMNAVSFWEKYGGQSDVFDVNIYVDLNNNGKIELDKGDEVYSTFTDLATNTTHALADDGIEVTVNLNNVGTQSSFVKVSVNNKVKTQHTYGGEAANYIVVIRIPSENVFEYGNFVLTQNFSVADSCPDYKYNERSYLSDAEKLAAQFAGNKTFAEAIVAAHTATGVNDAILVKGDIVDDSWEIRALASETFDVTANDDTIFDYYATLANVNDIVFAWYDATVKYNAGTKGEVYHWADAAAAPAGGNADMVVPVGAKSAANDGDFYYQVVKTMYKNFFIKTMNLTQELVNGEECGQTYNVVFVNPFYGQLVDETPVKIFGNTPGDQIVNVRDKVVIKEIYNNNTIATWSGAQFVVADNIFAVANGDVVYTKFEWIMSKGDNQAFANAEENAFTEKLVLSDAGETNPGNIKWNNYDTALSQAYNLVVTATVAVEPNWNTVDGVTYPLQVVTVDIPVYLAAERK